MNICRHFYAKLIQYTPKVFPSLKFHKYNEYAYKKHDPEISDLKVKVTSTLRKDLILGPEL